MSKNKPKHLEKTALTLEVYKHLLKSKSVHTVRYIEKVFNCSDFRARAALNQLVKAELIHKKRNLTQLKTVLYTYSVKNPESERLKQFTRQLTPVNDNHNLI